MARRRKTGRRQSPAVEPAQATKKPAKAATSLGALLKAAGRTKLVATPPTAPTLRPTGPQSLTPVHPSEARKRQAQLANSSADSPAAELRMLNDAYEGARPLTRKRLSEPAARPALRREAIVADRAEEAAARARLAALVGGGVRFSVTHRDEYVQGHRSDVSAKLVSRLAGKGFSPEATLDLHGQRSDQVADRVAKFVRTQRRRGARNVLIIAGKGLHSEGGVGVLRDATIDALTQGLAAPVVAAFSSAHETRGGSGALAVLLS